MKQTFIYIPNSINLSSVGFLSGFTQPINNNLCQFITTEQTTDSVKDAIGLCGSEVPPSNLKNWVHINNETEEINVTDCSNITCVYYDYGGFKEFNAESLLSQKFNEEFKALMRLVNTDFNYIGGFTEIVNRGFNIVLLFLTILLRMWNSCKFIFQFSVLLIYIKNYILMTKWLICNCKSEGKLSLRVKNLIISRLLDITIGIITFYYYTKYEEYILVSIKESAEFIVRGLKYVLNTLMDSPAGLKLNDALNKTLSVFFFYHISLWNAFIRSIGSFLRLTTYLSMLSIPFGVSFQVAILSNIISFLTFHVYCIYVYAARLYGVQLYGLTSLWKLFIGRKFNPLRDRVDSFQYSHNQLFVGTLGFSVLLFLMPTTFLYYAVFTLFRLILVLIKRLLDKIIYILQNLPLYMIILWLMHSYKVRGAVHLELIKSPSKSTLKLYITLKKFSFWECILGALAPAPPPETTTTLADLIKNSFKGTLL